MTPAPRSRTPATAISPIPISHVQFRDSLDPQRSDQHQDSTHEERDPPDERVEDRIEIVAAPEPEREEYEDRQPGQDPARDARLSREHLDEPPQLHSPADDLGHAVEHLGRVAARLALKLHDERDLL